MDRRLVTGGLAAVAAIALGAVGATDAAFSDFADVPGNRIDAGVLRIDLAPGETAEAPVLFGLLAPGATDIRVMWVSNDPASTPDATLALILHDLVDTPAPCDTGGHKAAGEIASGIGGCTVVGDVASGMPAQGNLSRVLEVAVAYGVPGTDRAACKEGQPNVLALPYSGRGNLYAVATSGGGAGTTLPLTSGGAAQVLAPGQGVCVSLTVTWPPTVTAPSADHPVDDAAQGDALTIGLRFDLTQVQS